MSSWYIECTSTPSTSTSDQTTYPPFPNTIHQPPNPSCLPFFSSLRNPTTHPVLTEMIKVQNPLPSSLGVPIQNAQPDTSLLACLLDDDGDNVDVSGFS
jgi:hypothetical protein